MSLSQSTCGKAQSGSSLAVMQAWVNKCVDYSKAGKYGPISYSTSSTCSGKYFIYLCIFKKYAMVIHFECL